jgi:hypothetical protein
MAGLLTRTSQSGTDLPGCPVVKHGVDSALTVAGAVADLSRALSLRSRLIPVRGTIKAQEYRRLPEGVNLRLNSGSDGGIFPFPTIFVQNASPRNRAAANSGFDGQ